MAFNSFVQSPAHRGTSILTLSDTGVGDNSKILNLVDLGADAHGAYLELLAIRVEFAASATVGTRTLTARIELDNGAVPVYELAIASNTVVADADKTWQMAPAVNESITSPTQQVQLPPGLHLYTGVQMVIEDSADIDGTSDDMIIYVLARLFDIRSL